MVTKWTIPGVVAAGLALGTGCASNTRLAQTQQDLVMMSARVAELERVNGRNRVLLEEMEERVYLLQDRVEAARLALQRRDLAPVSTVSVPIQQVAPYQSFPSASAPSVFAQNNTYPMPSLPIQQLGPGGQPVWSASPLPVQAQADDEMEEVVITMETLEERFGAESRAAARTEWSSTGGVHVPAAGNLNVVPVDRASAREHIAAASSPPVAASAGGGLSDYRAALDLFNGGNYAQALERLDAFVAGVPEADYMDNAFFWMGECYYGLGRYDQALSYFQRVVSEYPDGNKVPDSLLKVALSHERLSNTSQAIDILSVLAETYPTTDAARRASERLRALQ